MKNCMVDLETLGTSAGCTILSIGAVMFDPETGDLGKEFYTVISRKSCADWGLYENADTIDWWSKQSSQAQTVLHQADTVGEELTSALSSFHLWLLSTQKEEVDDTHDDIKARLGQVKVWGNGSDFDNAMLGFAYYKVAKVGTPWQFYNNRCYRTLKEQYKHIKLTRSGTYHNALDDAKSQAWHCIELLQHQEDIKAKVVEKSMLRHKVAKLLRI